jgi:hypothetical protein
MSPWVPPYRGAYGSLGLLGLLLPEKETVSHHDFSTDSNTIATRVPTLPVLRAVGLRKRLVPAISREVQRQSAITLFSFLHSCCNSKLIAPRFHHGFLQGAVSKANRLESPRRSPTAIAPVRFRYSTKTSWELSENALCKPLCTSGSGSDRNRRTQAAFKLPLRGVPSELTSLSPYTARLLFKGRSEVQSVYFGFG